MGFVRKAIAIDPKAYRESEPADQKMVRMAMERPRVVVQEAMNS